MSRITMYLAEDGQIKKVFTEDMDDEFFEKNNLDPEGDYDGPVSRAVFLTKAPLPVLRRN